MCVCVFLETRYFSGISLGTGISARAGIGIVIGVLLSVLLVAVVGIKRSVDYRARNESKSPMRL